MASDFQKPDGLAILYPNDVQMFLENLEVQRISGIGAKTRILKEEMGIQTIGQLAKYDVQDLMDRFGKKMDFGCGRVAMWGKIISLSTESTLETFTKDKEVLLKFLLNELCRLT
jgi:DNA polymerase-4